jgi:hypothetical protein
MMPKVSSASYVLSAICLASAPIMASAFELPTHGAMTAAASNQSRLLSTPISGELLRQLGLVDFNVTFETMTPPLYPPLGRSYIDIGSELKVRNGLLLEDTVIASLNTFSGIPIPAPYQIGGWIMRGAIREDDNKVQNGPKASPERQSDEPGGVFDRILGHFFDPKSDTGLSVTGIELQPRAVDWALQSGTKVNAQHENHFKAGDAREAMWRALTLTRVVAGSVTGEGVIPTAIAGGSDAEKRENTRKAYWATTFRALGEEDNNARKCEMGSLKSSPRHGANCPHAHFRCKPAGKTDQSLGLIGVEI